MTKFEELITAYDERRARHKEHVTTTVDFACDLFEEFVRYTGCPPERIRFYEFDKTTAGAPTPDGAMSLCDDGRIGTTAIIEIRKAAPPGTTLAGKGERFVLDAFFDSTGTNFTVQVNDQQKFSLDSPTGADAVRFFDYVLEAIMQIVRDSYKLEKVPTTFGFQPPSESES